MDTPETDIVQGVIKPIGKVHGGALNCMVWLFGHEDEWVFKQFVGEEELDKFAKENSLAIRREESDAHD